MIKKYIVCFLILSILNFTGCTYLEVISKEDVTEERAEINLSEELYLTTKDFTRYHFLPANYQIANDTLYGKGAIESSSPITPFQGKVALNEIISFEQKKSDTVATIGLVAGITAVVLLVLSLIVTADLSDSFNPD
ncbi:MAG: hypothetical protein HXY48_00680 [Ignavibacteriaceae bacterium]|nr:hypothetical protein [Ignavibacteriaceae bacterium]